MFVRKARSSTLLLLEGSLVKGNNDNYECILVDLVLCSREGAMEWYML